MFLIGHCCLTHVFDWPLSSTAHVCDWSLLSNTCLWLVTVQHMFVIGYSLTQHMFVIGHCLTQHMFVIGHCLTHDCDWSLSNICLWLIGQETFVYRSIQMSILSGSSGQLPIFPGSIGNWTRATCMGGICLNHRTTLCPCVRDLNLGHLHNGRCESNHLAKE